VGNGITKTTQVSLTVAGSVVVGTIGLFLWADAKHETMGESCKTETDTVKTELKEDIKEVKESVVRTEEKIDDIKTMLIQMNGGGP